MVKLICDLCNNKFKYEPSFYRHKKYNCKEKNKQKIEIFIKNKSKKNEKWEELFNNYLISNYGRIYSKMQYKLLKFQKTESGYYTVHINKKIFYIHRLVFETFNKKIPFNYIIDHIDNNRLNNNLNNLRLFTKKQNANNKKYFKGNKRSILQFNLSNQLINEYSTIKEAKKTINCKSNSMFQKALLTSKKYKGYIWKYKNLDQENNVNNNEIWVNIKSTIYSISNYGNIMNNKTYRILKPAISGGYYNISLQVNKKQKKYSIHRLVAKIFCENKENLNIVNHIDENKLNNYYKNLEWVTSSKNTNHSKYKYQKKVKQIDIKTNKIINIFDSLTDASINICGHKKSVGNISNVCNNRSKSFKGYKFCFI